MTALTLPDKLWPRHLASDLSGDMPSLHMNRHLVCEVASSQALEGLHLSGRKSCLFVNDASRGKVQEDRRLPYISRI